MEIPLSPTLRDAHNNISNQSTALPPENVDRSFYLNLIRAGALLQDDTTSLHSFPSEIPDGISWNSNDNGSNNVEGRERKRGREGEGTGELDNDSFPNHRNSGIVHGRRRPYPCRIVTRPTMPEEQERVAEWQAPALCVANLMENAEDMTIYQAYLRDPNDDEDESECIRSKRAKIAQAVGRPGLRGASKQTKPLRRLWVKQRPCTSWWDHCNSPDFPDVAFRKAFRMSSATFHMICDELSSVVARGDTVFRAAVPVRQRVAACIWRLATGDSHELVGDRFGLGLSTCHKLVPEVCAAITTVLAPKFMKWPSDAALQEIKSQFKCLSAIPNIVGSMHTMHIPILTPKSAKASFAAYLNKRHPKRCQKSSYSIIVQGVVGPDGAFTDVCIGWPGSMADAEVLEKSALYQRAMGGALNGQWIVGGTSYPLMDWLLVPYTCQNLTPEQQAFNENIREAQRVAKEAFVRLKGRWRCMMRGSKPKPQELHAMLGACCVLHNICEMRKEEMDPELRVELEDGEKVPGNSLRSESAEQERGIIAHKLFHHELAGAAFSNFLRNMTS